MGKFASIIILCCIVLNAKGQQQPGINVDDLLTLANLSPKNYSSYLSKKGFLPGGNDYAGNATGFMFIEKNGVPAGDSLFSGRSIEMYRHENSSFLNFRTSSAREFYDGRYRLKEAGFFYDTKNEAGNNGKLCFRKGTMRIIADSTRENGAVIYSFLLEKKEFADPGPVRFAEDLLKFDSHEHLAYYFGETQVKEDDYYISNNESMKCSVLFPNSNRQAVFVWTDAANLRTISFVIIGGVLPTAGAASYDGSVGQNAWHLANGVFTGMRLPDLIKLNGNDFTIFGLRSEFAFMAEPRNTKYFDFKKTGIQFNCFDCAGSALLNTEKVSAQKAADDGLALYVSSIIIQP